MSDTVYIVICEWYAAPSQILAVFYSKTRAERKAADCQTAGADVYVEEHDVPDVPWEDVGQ